MNFSSWQDKYGFIHLNENPGEEESENGVLFTAYADINGLSFHQHKKICIFSLWFKNRWRGSAFSEGDHFSHDNYLAMLYFQRKKDIKYWHTSFFDFVTYGHYHPRDFILFNYLRGHKWLFPLLVIPIIAIIVSILMANKKRTSGALLSRLRCKILGFKMLEKFCDMVVNKKFGSWHNVYSIYFKNENHPCRILSL